MQMIQRVLLLVASVAASTVQAQDQHQFETLQLTEYSIVAARLMSPAVAWGRRWAGVEVKTLRRPAESGKLTDSVPTTYMVASVDCASRGFEVVRQFFNLETRSGQPERWSEGPVKPEYASGFNPVDIEHRPVSELLAAQLRDLLKSASEEERRWLAEPRFAREAEELAVDFACGVVREGRSEREVATQLMETAGLQGANTLKCALSDDQGRSQQTLMVTVRFHEPLGFVQVQGEWVKQRRITSDQIWAKYKDASLTIDRITGTGQLVSSSISLSGSCNRVRPGERKF